MRIKTRDLIEKKECGKPPSNPCTDRSRPVCRLTIFYQTPNTPSQIPNTSTHALFSIPLPKWWNNYLVCKTTVSAAPMVRLLRNLAWDLICSRSLRDEMELSIICFKYIFQLFEIKLVISTTLLPTELNDPRWWSTKITIKNKQFCSQKIVQLFLWMRDSQMGESDIWGKNSQIIPFFFVWPVYIYAVITGQTWDKQSNLFSVDLYLQPNWGWLFREDWVHHPNWGYSSICTKFPKSLGFLTTG